MSAPIVVGHDPHDGDDAPVRFGIAAARLAGARLLLASVGDANGRAEALRRRLEQEPGIRAEVRIVAGHSVARRLRHLLDEVDAGLGVVGAATHGRLGPRVAGSTAERLLHGAPCPVAVVPHGSAADGLRSIGVAFARTAEGEAALRAGAVLANAAGARLRVITALHEDIGTLGSNRPGARAMQQVAEEVASEHHLAARAAVAAALAEAGGTGDAEVELVYGDPAQALLGFTASLDVLVMGSRCPVIVLPRGSAHPLREWFALEARAPTSAGTTP